MPPATRRGRRLRLRIAETSRLSVEPMTGSVRSSPSSYQLCEPSVSDGIATRRDGEGCAIGELESTASSTSSSSSGSGSGAGGGDAFAAGAGATFGTGSDGGFGGRGAGGGGSITGIDFAASSLITPPVDWPSRIASMRR